MFEFVFVFLRFVMGLQSVDIVVLSAFLQVVCFCSGFAETSIETPLKQTM